MNVYETRGEICAHVQRPNSCRQMDVQLRITMREAIVFKYYAEGVFKLRNSRVGFVAGARLLSAVKMQLEAKGKKGQVVTLRKLSHFSARVVLTKFLKQLHEKSRHAEIAMLK